MEISPELSYPVLPNDARFLAGRSPSRLGQGPSDGQLRCAIRRLDPVGSPTPHRIPTTLVPGRGDHCAVRRLRPPSRATLRMGPGDGPEGSARTAARDALPGELRRAR